VRELESSEKCIVEKNDGWKVLGVSWNKRKSIKFSWL
jgi:hypothetical protein